MRLTDEQEVILNNCDSNCYISAAPGSGKSTVLGKIAERLLVSPTNQVLLVTFTNKAARSIISKCEGLDTRRIIGGTFHSIAYRTMRQHGIDIAICDESKKRTIIKKRFNCRKDRDKFEALYDTISLCKSEWPQGKDPAVEIYNEELRKYDLYDFDDIIYGFISRTQSKTIVLPRITHCLVDELQDTSGPQLEMLKQVQDGTKCKMIGVADDDQQIYSWRGARQENVTDFISVFNCKVMNMGYNFRSATKIVTHSAKLIENNTKRIKKTIRPFRSEEGSIIEYPCLSPFKEIDYIVVKCLQHPDRDIAILYRNRMWKYQLEFELKKAKIPYRVNDFTDLTDRSAVRVLVACLKIAAKKYDIYDLKEASKALKGLGKKTVENIEKRLDNERSNTKDVITNLLANKKWKNRVGGISKMYDLFNKNKGKNLSILLQAALGCDRWNSSFEVPSNLRSFMVETSSAYRTTEEDIVSLTNDLGLNAKEEQNDEGAKVELSTVHGYKGLEKDIVIMPWCQAYLERLDETNSVEDERRLFYVAATRAMNKLYLTYSGSRPRFVKEMKL